jgi:hypothetical protein
MYQIYLAVGVVLFVFFTPRGYDYMNSTRQILKFRDINAYITKKKEYSLTVIKLGEMCRRTDVSCSEIANILCELQSSPFYVANEAFREVWEGDASMDKLKALYKSL